MRHVALLFVVLLLVVGLVPAHAQTIWTAGLYLDSSSKVPAGRISIWFSDYKTSPAVFYYKGTSKDVLTDDSDPAYRFCFAKVELTGPYATQVVRSTWDNLGALSSNTFVQAMGPGEQEFRCYYQGKEKHYLRIAFIPIPIGSSAINTEQGFRVLAQSGAGLTSYKCQLALAKNGWPSAPTDFIEQWARLYSYETHYKAQGMVLAGTDKYPNNDTASLRAYMTMMQMQADERAAAAKAKADAEAAKAQSDAEAKCRADAQVQAEQDRLAAEAAKPVSWSVTFPDGKVAVEMTRTDAQGHEVVSRSREGYGWKKFPGVSPQGTFYLRAKYADGSFDAWRQIVIGPGVAAQFDKLPEFSELPKEVK